MNLLQSGEFYSAACALAWAIAVIFFRKSGEQTSPLALNTFKNTIAFTLTLCTLPVLGVSLRPPDAVPSDWFTLFGSGMLGIGIADTMFFASLNRLGAGRVAIVDSLYSPFVLLCSFIYLHEPVGLGLAIAIPMMVAAILLGAWEPARSSAAVMSAAETRRLRTGTLLGIISVFFMAAGIVWAKPVLNHSNVWWATTVRLAGGFTFLGVQSMLSAERNEVWRALSPNRRWRVMFPGAFIGSYIALFLWTSGMKLTTTVTASVLNQLSNVFIMILAAMFLRERFGWRQWLAILIGFGAGFVAVY